ncbi:MAG TPA: enoyl-CoA hydratase [Solirubrobacteraceae bacterium]|nr:enoyl-CoA hydratase [Solirubrobacteraceae bacterium]
MTDFELQAAYDTVNLWRAGAAAKIELNRPDRLNAWDRQLSVDLLATYEAVRDDDDVRAVMLTGAGRAFCSGADLTDMESRDLGPDGRPDLQRSLHERYHPVLTGLRRLPKPVVSAVNGPSVGVGMSLALTADLVYATPSAYFLLAFVNIGLVPDGGSSAFVPARIGVARATELAMLGERLPAEKAADWGLINGVFAEEAFDDEVASIVARLAAGPTSSYAGTKRQLNAWAYDRLDEQLELEAQIQQEMAGTADFAEGVTAFAQKRQASFTGR